MIIRFAPAAASAALALCVALPAVAQDTVTGVGRLDDRIDDITDTVQDDLDRGDDDLRYGPQRVVQGLRGSVALTGSAADGNAETADVSVAGRLNYGVGAFNHSFGIAGEFGESDGVTDEEQIFAIYEGSRYFTPAFYVFGTGRLEYDGFATNERDAFVGVGPGYRIFNSEDLAWRVQAGVGARYVEDQNGDSETDTAVLASSRFFYGLTDLLSLTNDTDVLASDVNTVVTNDIGANYRLSNALSARVSYRTDYNSDPLPGLDATDNTFGVSLVVGF